VTYLCPGTGLVMPQIIYVKFDEQCTAVYLPFTYLTLARQYTPTL